jgi:ferredoxin
MNAEDVKRCAREHGADLVGIASPDRFHGEPPERHPTAIFPECRSVIVLGRRILRGSLRGVEEGTNFGSTYGTFGFRYLEDNFLARTTYDVTCWIEARSFEAVPLFGYAEDGMPQGMPVAEGKPAPNVIVDVDRAAAAAGLGEMGLGGFFLTPEFGPRQRFALILTDAALAPDPVREPGLCGVCGACAAACPLGAIRPRQPKASGTPASEAVVDYRLCRTCRNGAMSAPGRGDRPDRLAAACVRACVVKLEQAGKCANAFEQPFRKRTPWALDALVRPAPAASVSGQPSDLGCRQNLGAAGRPA